MEDWWKPSLIGGGVSALSAGVVRLLIWIGSVQSDRKTFATFVNDARKDLRKIRTDIARIFERLPPPLVSAGSPLRLTELGQEIAADLGAQKWAEREALGLLEKAVDLEPFEVDKLCRGYTQGELSKTMTVQLDRCSYERGISGANLRRVLHVVLRDEVLRLLEKRPPSPKTLSQ